MKKTILAIISLSLLLCSCEKEIEFKGKYDGKKIVLYSTVNTMDTLSVRVLRSFFILRTDTGQDSPFNGLHGAQVTAFVNGSEIPLLEDGAGFFRSRYVPKPGDEVTVKASCEGYRPVSATTVVPERAEFSIEKVEMEERIREDNDYWATKMRTWDLKVRIRINDKAGVRDFYRLKAYMKDGEFQNDVFAMTRDVIFMNQGDELETIEGMINGDDYVYLPELIDDSMFEGKSYAFDIWFEVNRFNPILYADYGVETEEPGEPVPDLELSDMWFEVDALSSDLYKYAKSVEDYEIADGGLNSFFGEKVSIYSNVDGGIGCVGALTPGIIYLSEPTAPNL